MTVGEKYRESIQTLEGVSPTPALDVSLFFEDICSLTRSDLILHSSDSLDPALCGKIDECVGRRVSGIPVAYILGHKGFWKSDFLTPEGVLIPRPDTETLVQEAVDAAAALKKKEVRILDLCAGTGCAGISAALSVKDGGKKVFLTLSDISGKAYEAFKANAENLLGETDVKFCLADLFDGVGGCSFDLIISNPPYIKTSVIGTLEKEVRTEPLLALDGGEDGLDLIRKIVRQAPLFLGGGGYLLLEIGYDQGKEVKKLFEESLFEDVNVIKDLGDNARVVKGKLPNRAL